MSNQPPPLGWQQAPRAPGLSPYSYLQQLPQPQKGKGFALVALVLGIFGSCFGLIPIFGIVAFPLAVVGLVFGVIAIVEAGKGVRTGKGMAIVGTILCVLALVLATIGIVIVEKAFKDLGHSVNDMTGQSTEEILQNDLDVQLGHFVTDNNPYVKLGKMVVTLHNKSSNGASFSVEVEAVGASGNRIADDATFVQELAPSQSTQKDMFVQVTHGKYAAMKTATFKVVKVSKYASKPLPT
jgi:hypothetical protein